MKFLDLFNEIEKGNYSLTDEAVYASLQHGDELISLYGGNKTHVSSDRRISVSAKTKKGEEITVFSKTGIIISLDGSAGSMTYKCGEKFALNHHAGFITLRDDAINKVSLEYFALFFQNFYRAISVSDGSKTLSLSQIYSADIDLPRFNVQMRVLNKLKPIIAQLNSLYLVRDKCNALLLKKPAFIYKTYQATNVPIGSCIDYLSGNSGLTEEFIYQALQNDGDKYIVLSSATEERTMMGAIPMCTLNNKPLKIFENSNGLLVTRNGKAGRTRYIQKGKYTINDHAYILFVKDNSSYKIDLRWLAIQYQTEFLSFSSSSDNGTWNMTGFFQQTVIDIPSTKEQKKIVDLFNKLYSRINAITTFENQLESLLSKEIA